MGAIPAIIDKMDVLRSILYTSSLPTFSILFSMASIGLPIRCNPLSIIFATGLLVFFAKLLAAEILPVIMLSRIMLIKLSSILPAFRIAINLSAKTKMAAAKSKYKGYIIHPPLLNKSIIDIFSATTFAPACTLFTVSATFAATCNK